MPCIGNPPPPSCQPDGETLCLNDGRFQAQVNWTDAGGTEAEGQVFNQDTDSGEFWFFSPSNTELLVKVLDGCRTPFNSFWVFHGSLTNVEFTLTVRDTDTNEVRTFEHDLEAPFEPVLDTGAFFTCKSLRHDPVDDDPEDGELVEVSRNFFRLVADGPGDGLLTFDSPTPEADFVAQHGGVADLTGVSAFSGRDGLGGLLQGLAGCDGLGDGVVTPADSMFSATTASFFGGIDSVSLAPPLLDGTVCRDLEFQRRAPGIAGGWAGVPGGGLGSAQTADDGFVVVSLSVAEPIPLASDTVLLTYAAVFDRNADSIDNFHALPQFALDFFQDTDLWYEARWTSSGTWRLTRWIVVGGVARTFETRAVVVLVGNVLMFVIPRDEFPATTTTAPFRVSAFVSDRGDPFGLNTGRAIGDTAPFVLDERASLELP